MIFNCFRPHKLNDDWKYFEVIQMAQSHIIFWWSVIVRSQRGAKERRAVSLIITSLASACLDLSKPPSSGEAMSLLCHCRMKHSSKSFGTFCFTPDYSSVISKVSRAIGDSSTFEYFILNSSNFCLNALLTFFFLNTAWFDKPCHLFIVDLSNQMSTFFRTLFPQKYALDMLHWNKSLFAWT